MVLLDAKGHRYWVPDADGPVQVERLGVVDRARLRGKTGCRVEIGTRPFLVLEADTMDLLTSLRRGAQTIGAKDVASLLLWADVRPGNRVVEAGSGTGSLTLALARTVGPQGSVVSYDLRPEASALARRNLERAGLGAIVTFHVGDIRGGIADRDQDAVFLDIPDPWAAVESAWAALRPCGHLAAFSPNMEQVKETVAALRAKRFVEVRSHELLEREMEVHELGVRPSFAALGHTGYLTFARKVLDTF